MGLCLAQTRLSHKSNQITALPSLIETLSLFDLAGCTVTVDAMGSQREVARCLIEKEAGYVLTLNDNQPWLAASHGWLFEDALRHEFQNLPFDACETFERAHGREERRRCSGLSDLSLLKPHAWPGRQSVVLVEARRTLKGGSSTERRYYLSSLEASAARTLEVVRAQWGVENGLHWVLDVVFNQDAHRGRSGRAAANLGVLRRLALNLL